jgi:hypothetical protein
MAKNNLNQVTSIENLEENGATFDELVEHIKKGRADAAVSEMGFYPKSDRDTLSYDDILNNARTCNERIVYDDGHYLLTASSSIITLYEYVGAEDMLGDELEIGDKVLWADPDAEARDLNRVWEVYGIQSEELVKIFSHDNGYHSEAEVNPSELVKKSSIIHVECE